MNKVIKNEKLIDNILDRGVIVDFLPSKKLFKNELLTGKRLKFYIGIDATASKLHLSHMKNFMLMERFRQLGHEIIILFGDFTAKIGDPTEKRTTREKLTTQEVNYNCKKWKKFIEPFIDFHNKDNPAKIVYNSHWLAKLKLEKLMELASMVPVKNVINNNTFQIRMNNRQEFSLHELLYPILQGYDGIHMNIDVEVCGKDQVYNAKIGQNLLKEVKNKNKFIIVVNLMENPQTGEIMSKSEKIGIFLGTDPKEMYDKIVNIADEMIETLFVNCTYLPLEAIMQYMLLEDKNKVKHYLAFEIIKIIYGKNIAHKIENMAK